MKRLFALAIFLAAALLFLVQPLAGKILLPVLGGSPAVWSSCIVFFQAVLLLGYVYAHVLSTRVAPRWQALVHVCVLVAASTMLPLSTAIGAVADADPRWWVLRTLAVSIGVPFFALSATAPLLQHWFSHTDDSQAGDPYFLYALSNAGSLLGLLAYPFVEPLATRTAQALGWSLGFWIVAALVGACAYAGLRRARPPARAPRRASTPRAVGPDRPIRMSQRVLWIVLALVPSALLLGVTQHLATDVVSAPLLWVVPLALYLMTFIAAFSTRRWGSSRLWGTVAAVASMFVLLLSLAEVRYPILPVTVVHLAAFAALATLCHTRLAESRPDAVHLTGYFLCVSFGGVLGGAAVALVAPVVFDSILEYPIAMAAALFLRPQRLEADRRGASTAARWMWRTGAVVLLVAGYWAVSSSAHDAWLPTLAGGTEFTERITRTAFVIPAVLLLVVSRTSLLFAAVTAGLLIGAADVRTGGDVIYRERTFFGVHQVSSIQNGDWHVLTHGTTTHGVQAVRGKTRVLPTAYYHPSGPFGDLVFTLSPEGRFRDVGVVGLGAGALAGYAGNGTRMDFFEVDDAVIRIAGNPAFFTYLSEARARQGATVRTITADGRIGLGAMPSASYDLIVIDAFSSDAIPTHLITREAVALYASRLKPRGVIAFHVSSRFFNLRPALSRIAADRGLVVYARDDTDPPPERVAEAMRPSVWVVMARHEDDLGQIARSAPRWNRIVVDADVRLWTDDYINIFDALQE